MYGDPIGLGVRVPTMIISPWTRGGRVCSQVFDHTSVVRFLEKWTGVEEPNISAWRRKMCGDLTSAFDFEAPDFSIPNLPVPVGVHCRGGYEVMPPALQTLPAQEAGTGIGMDLPYQPNVNCVVSRRQAALTLTNAGAAALQLTVYPNVNQRQGPRLYDLDAGDGASDGFAITTAPAETAGLYDLTCYGPNGFQRRFAGDAGNADGRVEVVSSFDLGAGLVLALQNRSSNDVLMTVSNGYPTGGPWSEVVPARGVTSLTIPALADNGGWYDVTVTASSDARFLRRLAGRIETRWLAPPRPEGPTEPPVERVTPALRARQCDGRLVVSFPSWATNCVFETTCDLHSNTWTAVTAPGNDDGTTVRVTLPAAEVGQFFRLRMVAPIKGVKIDGGP